MKLNVVLSLMSMLLPLACGANSKNTEESTPKSTSRTVGHINYNYNPGTLTFQIPTQFASIVTVDTFFCPSVSVDKVQIYSSETVIPTSRLNNTSFAINSGNGAYIFGLAVTTSGSGACSIPVILE